MIDFSIIIPVFNGAAYIRECIKQVESQTIKPREIIVINDGSFDQTSSLLKKEAGKITKIINTKNLGPAHARNTGIAFATGKYVVFRDVDDFWRPEHLECLFDLIQKHPTEDFFCSNYIKAKPSTWAFPKMPKPTKINTEIITLEQYLCKKLRGELVAWTSAIAVRRDRFISMGGFNERFFHGEDQALWLKLLVNCNLIRGNIVSAVYVNHSDSLTSKAITHDDAVMREIKKMLAEQRFNNSISSKLTELYCRFAVAHAIQCFKSAEFFAAYRFLNKAKYGKKTIFKLIFLSIFGIFYYLFYQTKKVTSADKS